MTTDRIAVRVVESTLLAVVLVAPPWPARALAQTGGETACRAAVAGAVFRHAQAAYKVIAKCHRRRSAGKILPDVDCNDLAQADPRGRLVSRRAKLESIVGGAGGKCVGTDPLLVRYARCPSPGQLADDGGATDGIDTYAELAACLVVVSEELVEEVAARSMGLAPGSLDRDQQRCQREIGKRALQLFAAYGKERRACQLDRDRAGQGLEYGCGTFESNRIAKALSKLEAGIARRCDFADPIERSPGNETLHELRACGDTVEQLQRCIGERVAPQAGAGLIGAAYSLPAQCLAGGLVRVFHASFGSQITSTRFDAGTNGIAHGIDFNDGFVDPLRLDCDADCAQCQVAFDVSKDQAVAPCRCAADASVACDTLNGPDADDCPLLANHCDCFFGPPLAVQASGAPVCVPIPMRKQYEGSVDLGTGAWSNPLQVAAVIHLGGGSDAPCPLCEGDPIADDGVKGGTCSSGIRAGGECDVNGVHHTWGPVSLDCQPIAAANISGEGLLLNFPLSSTSSELPFSLPCDNPPGSSCPCRVCSDDSTVGCRNDQECIDAGAGLCTGTAGIGIEPNGCSDYVCGPDNECPAGPIDRYCDGAIHASGRGYITCQTDADCQVQGLGNCTLDERRRCFNDPLHATGRAGQLNADIAGIACLGATNSVAINAASGLPGPVIANVDFDSQPTCIGDAQVAWDPPAGASCSSVGATLPPNPCGDTFPICNGDCPPGQACANAGLACECQATP